MSLLGAVDSHDVFAWEGQDIGSPASVANEGTAGASTPTNMVPNGAVTFGQAGLGSGKAIQLTGIAAYLRTPDGTPGTGSPALDVTGTERCDSILAKITSFNPGGSLYTPLFNRFNYDQPDSWSAPYGTGLYLAPGAPAGQFLYYYLTTNDGSVGGLTGFPSLTNLNVEFLLNRWALYWGTWKGGVGPSELRCGVVYRDGFGVFQSLEYAVTGSASGLSLVNGQHGKAFIGSNPTTGDQISGYFSRARTRDAYPPGPSAKAFYENLYLAYESANSPSSSKFNTGFNAGLNMGFD